MQGISYGDDKEGEKKQKGKNSGVLSQGLSKAGSCWHPRAGGPLGERCLYQSVHPPGRAQEPGLSEWGPQSMHPDCRLTLSSMPVTLWCALHPVPASDSAPAIPTSNQWFVPRYTSHVLAPSVHGNSHTVPDLL